MSALVTRHPFIGFETDGLGENSTPTFGPDEPVEVYGIAPGRVQEPTLETDTPAVTGPTLWLKGDHYYSDAHSEWTVLGRRYKQDGESLIWVSPLGSSVGGTEIRLQRRDG